MVPAETLCIKLEVFAQMLAHLQSSESENLYLILEIADSISENNPSVHAALTNCLENTAVYAETHTERYAERGIDVKNCDRDTFCWIAMVDELEASGDVVGIDSSSYLEDFLWAVQQLRTAQGVDFSSLHLLEDSDVYEWYAVCNAFLKEKGMLFCGIDIDSDDTEVILVTTAVYDKISMLAKRVGHRIVPAETL